MAVIGLAFWPGHMNADTIGQIKGVAWGPITNQHAPLLEALWRPFWDLGVGPGEILIAQLLAFVAGAYMVLRAAFRPLGAAAVVALVALSPPLIGSLATVMRDTWFVALLLLTFGLVVRAAQIPWPARRTALGVAVIAAWLTLASRQNAAAAAAPAGIVIAGLYLASRGEPETGAEEGPRYRPLRALGVGIALTLALIVTQVGASRVIGFRDVNPEAHVYVYDLASLSEHEQRNLFPADVLPQRGYGIVDRSFTPDSISGLLFQPFAPIRFPIDDARANSLREAWWRQIREDPVAYIVDDRGRQWLRQIALTREPARIYHPLIEPNPFGFAIANRSLHDAATDYLETFADQELNGAFLFTTWVYLLVALLAAALLLRRGRPWPLLVVGGLALSALTYQVSLFFGAMTTQFRFEYPCVAIGMLSAAVLLRLGWDRWRVRRARPATY